MARRLVGRKQPWFLPTHGLVWRVVWSGCGHHDIAFRDF